MAIDTNLQVNDFYTVCEMEPWLEVLKARHAPKKEENFCILGTEQMLADESFHKVRIRQIGDADGLYGFERNLLAATIDTVFPKIGPGRHVLLKKRGEDERRRTKKVAMHSLVFDGDSRVCYVPTKNYLENRKCGTYKKLTLALAIPFQSSSPLIVKALKVNRTVLKNAMAIDPKAIRLEGQAYYGEVLLEKRFSCFPRISIAFWSKSTRVFVDSGVCFIKKLKVIEDLFIDVSSISCGQWKHENLRKLMLDLVEGLSSLHEKGIVHWDIKRSNALYRAREDRTIEGKWTDLGFSFSLQDSTGNALVKEGYYGSIFCTPPEVWGKTPFDGDFFVAESFALSILFYELLYQEEMPWPPTLRLFYENRLCVSEAHREQLCRTIQQFIHRKINGISPSTSPLWAGLVRITFDMMKPSPLDRLTINGAKERLLALEP